MQTAQINRGLHIKSSCALHRELFLNITIMSRNLLHLPHICKFPSRYSLAYSSGSSMASVFNAQSDPGVVLKFFSAFQQSMRSISISSPCHFYFVLYCFIDFSWSPLPLRSVQSRCPPDILWSSLRYGRCKADIHRMSCTLVFSLIRVRKHWWDDIT